MSFPDRECHYSVDASAILLGYPVFCEYGLNKCSQCSEELDCLDCNNLPFGAATSKVSDVLPFYCLVVFY